MIQVRTLGTAEVVSGAQRITPDSVILFALSLFMSVSAGQRIPRSRLLGLFWPDAPDDSRRHALRQLLYRLRRDGFPFSVDGEELVVDQDVVDSDVRRVMAARWPDEATPDEVRAVAGLLPGYDPPLPAQFREWLDEFRARVHAQYRRALLRQIDAARRAGSWNLVDEWARRCLDVDPLNEEATLAHAEAAAMGGSKAQALQIIDRYLNELGDRDRVIGLPAKVLRRRVSESVHEQRRSEAGSVPLIGRELEIAQLNDTLSGTLGGRSAVLFIVGAAGIGKSRIARELRAIAGIRGWRNCATQLQASDAQRPLGVFVDLFSALLQLPGALGCAPESLSQLRLLTAHDVRADTETQRSQEAEAVQERLRGAARDLLEAVVSEGPLVLVIDDLHWCDDASIQLLQHLVSSSGQLPVMWAFTARQDGKYEPVRAAMAEVRSETMRLGPLSPESANALFGVMAIRDGAAVTADSAELTRAVTGGNPLFVLELARHVRECGNVSSLPPSLRALIRDRATRLSPIAQHVLHTCAVLGRYASVPRVASVLEIGTAKLLACIEELDALGIVGAGGEGEVLSIHDLWREELMGELLPAARKLIHHRCGVVLEEECRISRAPATIWETVHHLLVSGSETRAVRLLEECAEHQLANGLPAEAAKTFALAFQASTTDSERLRATLRRIVALKRAADWIELAAIVGPAIELADRNSLLAKPHSDLELLQIEAMWRTESDLSTSLDRSLACTRDETASAEHRAHAALLSAIVADNLCKFQQLADVNEIARSLQTAAPDGQADILCVRLIHETVQGSIDFAHECGTELIALERRAGSVRGLTRALRYSSQALRLLGDFDAALSGAHEALGLAERHRLVGEAASAADTILSIHLEREDSDAAQSWIARCEALALHVGAKYARASIAINRSLCALLAGNHDDAMAHVAPYASHTTDPAIRQRMLCLSVLVRVHIARRDRERLAELTPALGAALALRRSTGVHDFHVASYAHSLLTQGQASAARSYVYEFVNGDRRDRTQPAAELRRFLRP